MTEFILKLYQLFEDNKAYFEVLDLPPVAFIDRFRGQPLNPEQFEYYPQPAIFVSWKTKWEKVGKFYNGKNVLDFHIVTDPTWDTSNISTSKEAGLKNVMYHNVVRYLLDDFESENTGKLTRSDDDEVDTGVVTYVVLRYECTYSDPFYGVEEYIEAMIETLELNGMLKKTV